jgi:hypothetical protein
MANEIPTVGGDENTWGAKLNNYMQKGQGWSDVIGYGADPTGVADSASAIQAAIDADQSATVFFPKGTYRIESTILLNKKIKIEGVGGSDSQILWHGAGGGTMFSVSGSFFEQSVNNIYIDGREVANRAIHLPVGATRNFSMQNVIIFSTLEAAIYLGDFSTDGLDADIAQFTMNNVTTFNCFNSLLVDSSNALGINLTGCSFTPEGVFTAISSQVFIKRGGSVYMFGCFIGGQPVVASTAAIHVVDGWISCWGTEFEWGNAGNGGSFLLLDTPNIVEGDLASRSRHTSSLVNCRFFGPGFIADSSSKIVINSDRHSLLLEGNNVTWSNETTSGSVLNNTGNAFVTSINNTYYHRLFDGSDPEYITSIRDKVRVDNTFNTGGFLSLSRVSITDADSNYTIPRHVDVVDVTSGTVTMDLPAIGEPNLGGYNGRSITIMRSDAGTSVTINRTGTDTIGGETSLILAGGLSASVTLVSNGFDEWKIQSYSSFEEVGVASTGAGSVKMANATPADSTGWVQVAPGKFVPYWTDVTP